MTIYTIIGIFMIAIAIALFIVDFVLYAVKGMHEGFALIWGVIGIAIVVLGVVLVVVGQMNYAVHTVLTLFLALILLLIFGTTRVVSILVIKVNELAMQVSLLNNENEKLLKEIEDIKGRGVDD